MKKLIKLLFLSVAVVAFTGCGDLNTTDNTDNTGIIDTGNTDNTGIIDTGNTGNTSVDINYLTNGYSIQGYDYQNNDVQLVYCNGDYEYYRGSSSFNGSFEIDGYEIVMSDYTDGGSYRLDSYNGLIEEGSNYYINYPYDITVNSITQISC